MAAAPSSLGEQISEELKCSICLELFTRPKVLSCQHTFCHDCLVRLAGWKTTFQCPNCHQQVELPPQGVAGLPDNHLVTSLCERLQNQATLSGETREEPQSGNRCSFHPTEVLRMYCKQCQMPVCEQCIEAAHDGHRTTTIKKAAQEKISTVQALINEGRNILESYCSFLRNLGEKERRLNEKKQQTDNDIIQSYYALLAEAEENHRKDLAKIQTERDRVLADVNELSAACDQAEQEMQEGGVDFLSQETILTEVVGRYRGKAAPTPVQTQPAVFQPTDTPVLTLGHILGLVTVPESVSSSPSQAASTVPNSTQEGHHRPETFAREGLGTDTLDITSLTFPPIPAASASINDELLQVFSGKNKKKRTRRKALTTSNIATEGTGYHPDNQRQDGFQPADNPELALGHATVQSLSSKPMIAPRPRNIAARGTGHHPGNQMQGNHRPLQNVTFGGLGSGTGQFNSPHGVIVSDKEVFVADCENYRIQVFTLQGTFVRQFPTVVSGDEEMYPHDVAMGGEGNPWVVGNTESAEFAVQYTKQGRVWRILNLQKTGRHRGVAVDTRRNHILITQITGDEENLNGEVLVFRPDGTLVRTVGQELGMVYPQYITVDGEGNILASDWSNHCVYMYNEDGQFMFWFGGEGSGEGQLLNPQGICTDGEGNIIMADCGNSRVEMFDKTGRFLKHIATDLEKPWAVAMATQGQAMVTDTVRHKVSIFPTI
ncbi:tripartite motif-containing protein 2-like [Branchiostoma floridae]|uniref:RING-type E3 ubiquitin transferase n=1 Tax=Branchiostoma floridae TaxID=7739 RepID=A0A9J7MCK4_BRAFL|nr:tripartite motif-containing protein 2-like [Branchiostoma floridae]